MTVEVDGERRTYDSLDELPPDMRARIEQLRRQAEEGEGTA